MKNTSSPFPKVEIRPRRSMTFLAILSIVMVVLSYFFVLLLATACVYLPFLILTSSHSGGIQGLVLFLFGIVIAGAMLWSLIPRPDKFKPPGLLLTPAAQPRLFAELENIAASLDQPMPREVYLIGEINAWVMDRGGFMGIGSRRVMGLGLPLLSILTVSQFRAVLVHEFAHYYGGDTRLGPWVYKTQTAIVRVFQNIGSVGQLARFAILGMMYMAVSTLMKWYFIVFLRAINLVSRKKEYRADELACLVAGSKPLIEGLRAIHGASPAWPAYWESEITPLVNDGALPGIAEGFARFIAVPRIREQIDAILEKEIREAKSNPYDTHPPLRDRVAAAQMHPGNLWNEDTRPARTLLDRLDAAELRFLETMNPKLKPGVLESMNWDEVGIRVSIPGWKKYAAEYSAILDGVTADSLPDRIPKLREIGFDIRDPEGMLLSPEQRTQRAAFLFAIGLGLSLIDHGWTLHKQPGVFHFQRGEEQLNPFVIVEQLQSGSLSPQDWVLRCRALGIAQIALHAQPSREI